MKDPAHKSAPARILLVDDNRLGLIARKSFLEDHGFSVVTVMEGQEALAEFDREKYDLVVTDYKMPKMDGLELIRQIRQRTASVPIVLISGYADALGLTEAGTGADAVISKSANEVPQLLRAVGRLLKRTAPKKPPASHRHPVKARRHSIP